MPDEIEQYSLRTQILMDFEKADKQASEFGETISWVSEEFSNLSKSVKNINLDVANVLKKEIAKFRDEGILSNEFDIGAMLKEKVEKAIAYNLAKRDVFITGAEGEKLQVNLTKKQLENITKDLRDRVAGNINITPFTLKPLKFTPQQLKIIQEKFSEALVGSQSGLVTDDISVLRKTVELKINEFLNEIKQDINSIVNKVLTEAKFENGDGLVINLNNALKFASVRIEEALKDAIQSWSPKVPSLNLNSIVLNPVKDALKTAMISYAKDMREQIYKFAGIKADNQVVGRVNQSPIDVEQYMAPINKSVNKFLKDYITTVSKAIMMSDASSMFQVAPRNLHTVVRRSLAQQEGLSVREFTQNHPLIKGIDALNKIMQENIRSIFNKFHDVVQKGTIDVINEYQKALKQVTVEPNQEAVLYLAEKLNNLQLEIVRKVKQVLNEQFSLMTKEIKGLKLYPISVGYTPPAMPAPKVQKTQVGGFAVPAYPTPFPVLSSRSGGGGWNIGGIRVNPGGDTHSFIGSVINTMRYITAGSLMAMPYMAYYEAWQSAKQFDYDLEKARQNLLAKDETMETLAKEIVKMRYEQREKLGERGIKPEQYRDKEERNKLIKEEAANLQYMAREGIVRPLQDLALLYGINQEDVGKAWQISTRRLDNPYEAYALTKGVSKIFAYERDESNPEDVAKGLEAIASQWGLTGYDMPRVANMLIKTAALSQATIQDLLQTQSKAGAVFKEFMPGKSKLEAFATSLALSSFFVQATARSGNEGGTFWRTVFRLPFGKKESEYLKQKSQIPGFEMLNPYEEVIAPGQEGKLYQEKIYKQKSGIDMFVDIVEGMLKMNAKDRAELIDTVYKQRFGPGAMGIQEVIQEIERNKDKIGKGGLHEYIQQIIDVQEKDIAKMIAGMQNTWVYRTQRIRTAWQISTFEIFDNLKGEFGTVSNYLVAFLRQLRDNANLVSNLISVGTKLALVYGARWFSNRFRMGKAYKQDMTMLMEEERFRNLQRIGIMDEMNTRNNFINKTLLRRNEIGESLNKTRTNREVVGQKLETAKREYNELQAAGASSNQLSKKEKHIRNLQNAYSKLENQEKSYESQVKSLDAVIDRENIAINRLTGELSALDVEMGNIRNRAEMLDLAFREMGYEGGRVSGTLGFLEKGFRAGTVSAQNFEVELKNVAKASGLSDKGLTNLRAEVDLLCKDLERGSINAQQFATKLRQLERDYKVAQSGIVPQGQVSSTTGAGLLDLVIASSLLKGGMSNPQSKGILGKALDKVKGYLGLGVRGGAVSAGRDALGVAGKLGGGALGFLRGLGLRSLLGWTMAFDAGTDILGSLIMKPYEKAQTRADYLAKEADFFLNYQKTPLTSLSRVGYMFTGLYNTIVGSISHFFGGSKPSIVEYGKLWGALLSGDSEKLKKYAQQMKDKASEKSTEAFFKEQEEQDKLLRENPNLLRIGGKIKSYNEIISVEDAQEIIAQLNEEFGRQSAKLESEFTINKSKKILAGYREDSEELRKLMDNFLQSNINLLQQAINEIQDTENNLKEAFGPKAETLDSYRTLEQEKLAKQAQVAELRLQKEKNKESEYDEVTNSFERRKAMAKAENDILRADVILGGAKEGSFAERRVENQGLLEQNRIIQEEISRLNSLLGKFSNNTEMRDKILLEIKQLQAESKDNLVKINQSLNKDKSTFNLPSGIKPLTYWEAVTNRGTHKNMTVRTGNVTVNITIDKMSGDTKDVEKLSGAIRKTMQDINNNFINTFASNVKSGMGSTYVPFYR